MNHSSCFVPKHLIDARGYRVASFPLMNANIQSMATLEQEGLLRRGRLLEAFTITWNSAEGLISIALGLLAGSIALIGFGADSFIETASGAVLFWRLRARSNSQDAERAEARALQLVGGSLLLLAAYVFYDAMQAIILQEPPQASVPGIVLATASLIVMPLLARQKRKVAAAINSRALEADALQTSICTYLSAILLLGLTANALVGWWWADPLAALVMVPFIGREGLEALRGERCEGCAFCGTLACTCA